MRSLSRALVNVSCAIIAVSAVAPFNIHASAATESVTLTPAQTRALFGDSLTCSYFNGTDYVSTQLTYLTSAAIINPDNPPNFGYASGMRDLFGSLVNDNTRFVVYSVSGLTDLVESNQYTLTLEPTVNFTNCQVCNFVGGLSCSDNWSVDPNANPQNYVQYSVNGNTMTNGVFVTGASSTAAIYRTIPFNFLVGTGQYQQNRYFSLCPISYSSDTYSSINSFRFVRTGPLSSGSGIIRFILSCPTISVNTETSPDGGQTGTDLTATNIKLDTIISILSLMANQSQNQNNSYYDSLTPSDQQQQSQAQGSFDNDYSSALDQQADIDSVVNHQNLYSINMSDNSYPMDVAFNGLWNEGSGQTNPLILGMCLIPITIAVISYVLFGKKI